MKQLPRNVKIGPSPLPLCVADDDEDPFGIDDWNESFSVTPPPVSVALSYKRNQTKANPVAGPESTPLRRAGFAVWAAVLVGLAVALSVTWFRAPPHQSPVALRSWVAGLPRINSAAFLRSDDVDLDTVIRQRRADAAVRHDGYASIPGGVLYTPETFSSSDGSYDLLLHFHGNVKVVVQSAVAAKLNAAVAVVNLGVGSARYQDFYAAPGMYEELLGHIRAAMRRRGLDNPRLRRVALSAWSAGYGAISTILTQRTGRDPLDAILILDGIHTGYKPDGSGALVERRLAPFEEAAHAAASGDLLFTITYSEIDPPGYAGSKATANHLLAVARSHGEVDETTPTTPAYRKLPAMHGAVSKEDARRLEPIDDKRIRGFHVRGYRGNTRGHHMAHLFQMGATVLPELVKRWNAYAGYAGRTDAVHAERVLMRARGGK